VQVRACLLHVPPLQISVHLKWGGLGYKRNGKWYRKSSHARRLGCNC